MSWNKHKAFDGPRLSCLSDGYNNENMFLEYACWNVNGIFVGSWPYISRSDSIKNINRYGNRFWVI